jgi:periplasmic copper chaperone A
MDHRQILSRVLTLAACFLVSGIAAAQTGQLEVKDVWARATVGKPDNGAVYLTIVSPTPDRLVSASSPVANNTDLMTMEGGSSMMKMSYLKAIDVPANKPVNLKPDGLHVWLAGLKQPLKVGETFPLTLTFEKAGRREVTVAVAKPGARGP